MYNILVVDDEKEIVELIDLYFRNTRYNIIKAYDGIEAINMINNQEVNMVIVDLMMPNIDGYSLISYIRSNNNKMPIIVISAKLESYDKILTLDLGADDYLTKPFDPLELLARVKVQFRRLYNDIEKEYTCSKINIGQLELDLNKFELKKNNKIINLTSTEFKIIKLFMSNPNKVFTKKNLFESVWDEDYFCEDNAIMVHISKIRDKIEDDSRSPRYIKTIRGIGYKFEGNDE